MPRQLYRRPPPEPEEYGRDLRQCFKQNVQTLVRMDVANMEYAQHPRLWQISFADSDDLFPGQMTVAGGMEGQSDRQASNVARLVHDHPPP